MAETPHASSIDAAEIEKFSALAADWWNPSGPFGALHRLNPVRLRFIRDLAMRHFFPPPLAGEVSPKATVGGDAASPLSRATRDSSPHRDRETISDSKDAGRGAAGGGGANKHQTLHGLTALDLGCGGGLVSAPLARMGARVTGLDASAEAIGAARAYAAEAGLEIDFRTGAAEALADTGARFDLVAALEIIEHVADVGVFLRAASALVKPGGVLIVSTINRTAKARALAIFGAERILKWAPEGAHDYDKLVRPEEIRAGAPDLRWDEPTGVTFEPLGRGWVLSRDVSVNYLIAGRKPD